MKILIIEDEKELRSNIVSYLKGENYICEEASDFQTAMIKSESFEYDCILLDISLPDGNGLQVLRELKANHRLEGVIIISAKNSLDDRISGLNFGADDYLAKPFHLSELSARIAAIIRRRRLGGNKILTIHEISIDAEAKTVLVNNQPLEITKKEYDLLLYLFINKNRVISKNAIAEHLSADADGFTDNFDFVYTHIKNLKRKLSHAGSEDYIRSVYGMGYKFEV